MRDCAETASYVPYADAYEVILVLPEARQPRSSLEVHGVIGKQSLQLVFRLSLELKLR